MAALHPGHLTSLVDAPHTAAEGEKDEPDEPANFPTEWTRLYDAFALGPDGGSKKWKGLYAPRWQTLGPGNVANLVRSVCTIRATLRLLARHRPWQILRSRGQGLVRAKNRLLRHHRAAQAHRRATLDSWLQYWTEQEDSMQQNSRLHCSPPGSPKAPSSPKGLGSPKALSSPRAFASLKSLFSSRTVTPHDRKVGVLWDLYWMLYLQHGKEAMQHTQDLLRLRARYLELRAADAGESRHVVLAQLFLAALRPPKFRTAAGRDVSLRNLLRLANGLDPIINTHSCSCPSHSNYMAFLSSSLCTDPHWLQKRHASPISLVPPMSWCPPRRGTLPPLLADLAAPPHLPALQRVRSRDSREAATDGPAPAAADGLPLSPKGGGGGGGGRELPTLKRINTFVHALRPRPLCLRSGHPPPRPLSLMEGAPHREVFRASSLRLMPVAHSPPGTAGAAPVHG